VPSAQLAVLALLVVFPVVPWLLASPVAERFSGDAILKSIANFGALFGLAAWALNLVLASRVGPLERAFGGIDRLYAVHRPLGIVVVICAVTHVVFLMLHAGAGAVDLYLPSAGWGTLSGVFAFAVLVAAVAATIADRLSYQRFLLAQRMLGAAFLVGALHTFAVGSTVAGSTLLTVYLAALTALAAASLIYRVLGTRLGFGRRAYRVVEVHRLYDDAVEVVMAPLGRPLTHRAGQFLYLTLDQDGIPRESHPFTITSAPGEAHLRVAIKRLGDFTGAVMDLRPGARAYVEGPFGSFALADETGLPQTWIAGGIGITPFLSWARSLEHSTAADLYYCTPGFEQAHFLDELFAIADRHPALRVVSVRKQSLGRLTVADLEGINPRLARSDVFICGPPAMIANLTGSLVEHGVPRDRIHSESLDFRR
jgi:predicted ferric reductase